MLVPVQRGERSLHRSRGHWRDGAGLVLYALARDKRDESSPCVAYAPVHNLRVMAHTYRSRSPADVVPPGNAPDPSSRRRADTRRRRISLSAWLDARQAGLRYVFTTAELAETGLAGSALYEGLRRQRRQGRVVSVGSQRGLWAIVPLEHRAMGAPPIAWMLDDAMAALAQPYYLGLRSAAEWYGATHYPLQVTQVMVPKQLRPLTVGRTRVRFIANRHVQATPTHVPPGLVVPFRISTAEATAMDLLRFAEQAGGITAVVTALAQMQGACEPAALRQVLEQLGDVPSAQRLGYCWERIGATTLASVVAEWLGRRVIRRVALEPSATVVGEVTRPWNVAVGTPPDIDL